MRCIDADALKEKAWDAKTQCGYVQVVDVGDIDDAPTIEPERKKGKFVKDILCTTSGGIYGVRRCSLCESYYHDVVFTWNYCLELLPQLRCKDGRR